jgi:endo-1,4-beta-xylanase
MRSLDHGAARTLAAVAVAMTLGCGGKTSTAPSSPSPPSTTDPEPLRTAAASTNRLVGAAVQSSFLNDARYSTVLNRHFNYLTAEYEMKWATIGRTPGAQDFAGGDAIANYASGHGMQLKGHALVWHGSVPSWATGLGANEFRAAVEDHIRKTAAHYRGRVLAWDVVNEAIADDGSGLRDTIFKQKLGDQYIAETFRLAHDADPDALLFYNDYGGEPMNTKSNRIYDLVKGLRDQGVPINGVGLQMHITAANPPNGSSVAANLRRLADLGLMVNISEMDVRISSLPASTRLETQKTVYHSVVGLCLAESRCHAVTFWGFTDAHSWIDAQFGPDDPLLFDEQYAAKPAFFGVLDAFWRR